MKKTAFSKKIFALILSISFLLSASMPAFAAIAPFSTGGPGANPFNPRGYSIVENGKQYWLDSDYAHSSLIPTGHVHSAIWASDTNPANPLTKISYITSGDKQMYAWVDKGQLWDGYNMPYQRGFTTDPTVDVRYSFVVSINGGSFVSVPYAQAAAKNLVDSNGKIDATQGLSAFGYANRNVTDPDGSTGDWFYPLNFTLAPGTKYAFAYTRGFAANNGMSLVLSPDQTADGKAGYAGILQGPTSDPKEQAIWAAHSTDMYQYAYALTDLGLGVSTAKEIYSIEFKNFYHTVQTYADLTALNSTLSEATIFAGSVTSSDYKLGNYRKSSVDALQTLIHSINAKTNLNEELQTSVDALTKQLSDALTYAKEPAILVKGVTLDKNRADMKVGDTLTLKATVSPQNADNPTITWASSNSNVATVENGVVKAVSAGDASITATTADGGYTATCAIVVTHTSKAVANTDSSVGVNFDTSALPAGVSVGSVKNITVTPDSDKSSIVTALNNIGYTNLLINDVQLLDTNGSPITKLAGSVTVKIKIPDGTANDALSIFWYNPITGKLTDMNATKQDGFLVFTTNHFSYYVVAKTNAPAASSSSSTSSSASTSSAPTGSPQTSDNSTPIIVYTAAGLSIAAVLTLWLSRRRKNHVK